MKRASKGEARRILDLHRKQFPNLKIPKSLMTESELKELEKPNA